MRFLSLASILVGLGLFAARASLAAPPEKIVSAPTDGEVELAKKLYREGKELRDKGELQKSLDKLKAAHDLVPTPITRLEYAHALILLGSLVEGHALARTAATMPPEPGESDKAVRSRDEARKLAAKVDRRIPRLVLTVADAESGEDVGHARLELDGRPIEEKDLGAPMAINPGEHTIKVVTRSSTRTERFRIDEAETRTIAIATRTSPSEGGVTVSPREVDPSPQPSAKSRTPATAPTAPPAETRVPESKSGASPLVPVGFVLGAVGVTAGAITGTVALVAADKVKDGCRNLRCPPAYHADLDLSSYMGTASTVAFVVGGVGLLVGTIAVFAGEDGTEPSTITRVEPIVGPGYVGVGGVF